MIKTRTFNSLSEKQKAFSEINFEKSTYVVSDLESSKFLHQKLLYADFKVIEKDWVIRASSLWKKFFEQTYPEAFAVSSYLFKMTLEDWLKELRGADLKEIFKDNSNGKKLLQWAEKNWPEFKEDVIFKDFQPAKRLLDCINQLLPLLLNDASEDILVEWFEDKADSYKKWGLWYLLVLAYQKQNIFPFLEKKSSQQSIESGHVLVSDFIPLYLYQLKDKTQIKWDKKLIFDLSGELSPIEVQLIEDLSHHFEIEVWVPQPLWLNYFKKDFFSYDGLSSLDLLNKTTEGHLPQPDSSKVIYKEFKKQLSEVNYVVAKIRAQLDKGVAPHQIAIFAPRIEEYWPTLHSHLQREGIPFQKGVRTKLQSFPSVLKWLSHLRIQSLQIESGDIENAKYINADLKDDLQRKSLSFNQFKKLFSHIYSFKDLNQHSSVKELYCSTESSKEKMNRDQFMSWALQERFWGHQDLEIKETIVQHFFEKSSPSMKFKLRDWIGFLSYTCSQKEKIIESPQEQGVWCLNLSAAEHVGVDQAFFLGLNERSLTQANRAALANQEIEKLRQDLGFKVQYTESSLNKFYWLWSFDNFKQVEFLASRESFQGEPLVPAQELLVMSQTIPEINKTSEAEHSSRWDEIQDLPLDKNLELLSTEVDLYQMNSTEDKPYVIESERLAKQLRADQGNLPETFFEVPKDLKNISLSVNQLETYGNCPFVFAAQKLFGLKEFNPIDIDPNPLDKGTFLHAIFERMIKAESYKTWGKIEIEECVDGMYKENKNHIVDKDFWTIFKNQYVDAAFKFNEAEKKWRGQYPQTTTVGLEVKFEVSWDPEKQDFVKAQEGLYIFRGRIDRIDSDEKGHLVVIDYKLSGNDTLHHGSWIKNKNHKLQLGIYSQILEAGLLEDHSELKGEVISAVYYVINSLVRNKGFQLDEEFLGFLSQPSKNGRFKVADTTSLYTEIKNKAGEFIQKIDEGHFYPQPNKDDLCKKCHWRPACRFHQLNH